MSASENQDAYPDLLMEEFAPAATPRSPAAAKGPTAVEKVKTRRRAEGPGPKAVPPPKPAVKVRPEAETAAKAEIPLERKIEPKEMTAKKAPAKKTASRKQPAAEADGPSLDELLAPPHLHKLSVMLDEELQSNLEAAVTNLHNSGDFTKFATFADVYRKAFAYFFAGKLKPTEIYRKGVKKRTTLLVNEITAEKLQVINPRIRSRMLEQILRTFYRRHFND